MLRILFMLSIAAAILPGGEGAQRMKAFVYEGGTASDHRLTRADQRKIEIALSDLFRGVNDMLRIHVSETLVQRLRASETAIEFQFDPPREFISKARGKITVARLLLPLTGDYAAAGNDSVATLFVANERGFTSGPLRHPAGRSILLKLRDLLSHPPKKP
jgi:hypothetical protein